MSLMSRKNCLFLLLVSLLPLLGAETVSASTASELYASARRYAKRGQYDFAYMQYRALLQASSTAIQREAAWFAMAEYSYLNNDRDEAKRHFEILLKEFPNAGSRIFTLAYLYSITSGSQDPQAEAYRAEIIGMAQTGFVFRDSKDILFRSPLAQEHRLRISIDKMEFHVQGQPLVTISF